jgi:hypothetical protein
MSHRVRAIFDRIVPAVMTAAGVTALAAGLLNFASPAQAGLDLAGTSPSVIGGPPGGSYILPSLPPIDASVGPSVAPSGNDGRVATRVVIDSLAIDLPVIAQPDAGYPACNVAMYLQDPRLGQPGGGRAIYLYAHARTGMFLPLLNASKRDHGAGLLGDGVSVYTSDDQRYLYSIVRVITSVPSDDHFLDAPLAESGETLWLQTSTGPDATYPKLRVVAEPILVVAADHAAAHPKPRPVACG